MPRGLLLTFIGLSTFASLPVRADEPSPRVSGDPTLVRTMSPLLEKPALRGAKLSVFVAPVDDGPPVFAVEPDQPLHPASNTKLFTIAAALERLGPTFTWSTDLAAGEVKDGEADQLYLIGHGDPYFVIESTWEMAESARFDGGLRKVKGDLIVDDSFFTPQRLAPGFDTDHTDSAYRAATGAMSLDFNSVTIYVRPGAVAGAPAQVQVRPDVGYAEVQVDATTIARGRAHVTVSSAPSGDRTRIVVAGHIPLDNPGITTRRRIDDPPLFAGLALKDALRRAGIEVAGAVKMGKAPDKRVVLARHQSPSLAIVASETNKLSNNFMAETILRTLGAVKRGKGDWASGVAEVRDFLQGTVGLKEFKYVNGSGLFGDTAFSAAQVVKLLRYMAKRRPALPEFEASLAIGGADGTLRHREHEVEPGMLRAKTGTLDGVVCLSGYTYFADGTPAAFSILMNDLHVAPWEVWQVQDAMLEAIQKFTPVKDASAAR
jgi:D-alanyl-D-alanine carboxypeptidase/D-alanyl-D-alanine-endopeptidase (penicillin-binding protein 4)